MLSFIFFAVELFSRIGKLATKHLLKYFKSYLLFQKKNHLKDEINKENTKSHKTIGFDILNISKPFI